MPDTKQLKKPKNEPRNPIRRASQPHEARLISPKNVLFEPFFLAFPPIFSLQKPPKTTPFCPFFQLPSCLSFCIVLIFSTPIFP